MKNDQDYSMDLVKTNVSLRRYNTYGVDVTADYFVTVHHERTLVDIFNDEYLANLESKVILGGGSNLLFVDDYFAGLIVHMTIKGFTTTKNMENDTEIMMKVGAGEKWTDLIQYLLDNEYSGLEYLAGIPGTVGGALVQNIGAYGTELSDVCIECQVFDAQTKSFDTFNRDACQFGYRTSLFKQCNLLSTRYIITHVTFKLSKLLSTFTTQSKAIVDDILNRRAAKLPDPWSQLGNAGSFFTNPIITNEQYENLQQQEEKDVPSYLIDINQRKIPAGWLIEQCGWKNKSLGSAGTWHAHANVLVNSGSGTGFDIWTLAKEIRMSVEKRFHLRLKPEVHIIRTFKPIRDVIPSKMIIEKNIFAQDKNTIRSLSIPSDKNVCIHTLFSAIGLRKMVSFGDGFSENICHDVMRILQWIDDYNVAHLYFHNHGSLKIIPNEHKLVDLTTASFSRGCMSISGNTLLTYGVVRCLKPGGCQFSQRPIDVHLQLLVALGGHSDDGETFYLRKDWNNTGDEFEFDCRASNGISSVGVTINAILSCCALPAHIRCRLSYVALEKSVQTVMALARQHRPILVDDSERIIIFDTNDRCSNDHLVLEHLPVDQTCLFTMCSLAAMLQYKLLITNFEYDPCITEFLKTIMSVTIDETNQTALFDGASCCINKQLGRYKLICDVYPNGLPTDISPILTALFIARNISFELIDHVYDARNTQCTEFSKLGYKTITSGNQIVYNEIKSEKMKNVRADVNLYAHDIRGGVAVLLLALYHLNKDTCNDDDATITIHRYEQIERGYGSFLYRKLREFGFNIQTIRSRTD